MRDTMTMLPMKAPRSFLKSLLAAAVLAAGSVCAAEMDAAPTPRMADGHPDLSGVWWTGGDLGSPQYNSSRAQRIANNNDPEKRPLTFTDLYTPEAKAHAATLTDKDDPTLQCRPTAFGTLSVRLFDVGTIGQIVSTPGMMVFLQETFHGYQLIPTDGREPRDVPPSFRGDAVGHWEGDTFVVETKNFTDDTWIYAEGRVSQHTDQLRVVERYQRPDANTLLVDATVYDPGVLTAPWVVPTQHLVLAPFDQLLPLICTGVETQELMNDAAALKQP
ncbi:MAG: hypothetical protein H6978_06400 [Gammaproteobacteria bacterium]|nr:hypothetical protein [Gammaproteobacteria bacterium]